MSQEDLGKLRSELATINKSLLETIELRKATAQKIQEIKDSTGKIKYDPQREYDLFMSMRVEIGKLSDLELQAFSLLMQDHAGIGYPCWSQGEHLREDQDELKLNPLLLLIFRPAKLNLDALKDEFSSEFRKLLS